MAGEEKNELQPVEPAIKQSFTALGDVKRAFTPDQITFVMQTVAPGLNQEEVWLFLLKANALGLNPLLGEIFAYAYKDQSTGQRRLVIIEGRNGKRTLAAKSGKVEYIKTEAIYIKKVVDKDSQQEMTIKVQPWDGELWGATSVVKLKDEKTERQPVTVRLDEYNTHKSVWNSKPETMIKKVAESQALSEALPSLMYDLLGEGENFVGVDGAKTSAPVENPDEPASEQQVESLKRMGVDTENRQFTKQEAIDEMARIATEKSGKKSKEQAK